MNKKKIFGSLAVLAIAANAAINIESNYKDNTSTLLFSLNSIEALASETRCVVSSGVNTGNCQAAANGTGSVCVKPGWFASRNCYSHE